MKNLIIRTITGALFVASILASAIFSPYAFAILFFIMAIAGLYEYQRLLFPGLHIKNAFIGLIIGAIVYALFSLFALTILPAAYLWLVPALLVLLSCYHILLTPAKALQTIVADATGIVYVIIPLAMLHIFLNPMNIPASHTPWLLLGVFVILWTHDTFAYLTGSMFGKHPLYKSISPKKSWEGSIGGFGFALIAAYVISIFSPDLDTWKWFMIAVIITFFGTIGDLAESLLKRRAGVKDSGILLPGHGGVLDRFDSMLFVSPLVLVFVLLCSS